MTDKIVILAAGRGARMRQKDGSSELEDAQAAVADTGVKGLIPIDRPFLDYVLTAVADAGYRRVCLVTGPDHDRLRRRYAGLSGRRLEFEFVIQAKPRGTADALLSAIDFAENDSLAVINSDNFYPTSALESLRQLGGSGLVPFSRDALVRHGNIEADRATSFAMVQSDSDGYLVQIIEKPSAAEVASLGDAPLVSMNCWRFGPAIFEACRSIAPSSRGEFEIVDAVTHSMRRLEQRYRILSSYEAVLDLSFRRDVRAVAEQLCEMEVRL